MGQRVRSTWRQRKETTDENVGNKKGVWEKSAQKETEERRWGNGEPSEAWGSPATPLAAPVMYYLTCEEDYLERYKCLH